MLNMAIRMIQMFGECLCTAREQPDLETRLLLKSIDKYKNLCRRGGQ